MTKKKTIRKKKTKTKMKIKRNTELYVKLYLEKTKQTKKKSQKACILSCNLKQLVSHVLHQYRGQHSSTLHNHQCRRFPVVVLESLRSHAVHFPKTRRPAWKHWILVHNLKSVVEKVRVKWFVTQ